MGVLAFPFPSIMGVLAFPRLPSLGQQRGGEKNKKASGACTFSQNQGNVSIELANGNTVTLTPAKKADRFKDQNGKRVEPTTSGKDQVYKWKNGRKITVTFGSSQ